ncbi:MAG: glycoside hydrolase family 88 protein [Rikenellaceae bacterium]|nr:glycoside hydrolase family 88 protein [Rikenellaceae bacterium]
MKKTLHILVLAALLPACTGGKTERYSAGLTVEAVVRVVNDAVGWQLDNMPEQGREVYNPRHTGWADGVFLSAVAEWTLTDDSRGFRERLRTIAADCDYLPAPRTLNPANDIAVSMLYANLYLENPQPQYIIDTITDFQGQLEELRGGWKIITPTIERLDYQMKYYPELETLDFYQAQNQERWCWCDALYMAAPTYALIANITGKDEYREFMDREFWRTTAELYDPEERLFYRDTRFVAMREANGAKVFWGRGNGWVAAAIARLVDLLPEDYPSREKYLSLFADMMSRIVTLQDARGYWHTSLLDPESYPSPETSATGFYTYALWWGLNNGVLDRETYLPHAVKAWTAMVEAVHPGGKLGWVQPIGDAPENITADKNEVYGTAALALAGAEIVEYINSGRL